MSHMTQGCGYTFELGISPFVKVQLVTFLKSWYTFDLGGNFGSTKLVNILKSCFRFYW